MANTFIRKINDTLSRFAVDAVIIKKALLKFLPNDGNVKGTCRITGFQN
jgi:hypothetical protein